MAAVKQNKLNAAADVLARAVSSGQVDAASLYVRNGAVFARSFGEAKSQDAIFLLASITKPISISAVMTLYDRGLFKLDDPVRKFIPEFKDEGRDKVTMRQLLTHVSGLPDQLPENSRTSGQPCRALAVRDGRHSHPALVCTWNSIQIF